jgi:large subunit ribosomal protein L24
MKVKKGDVVVVLKGKDRGVHGEVIHVYPATGKVLVEGVNVARKHQKPTRAAQQGGIIDKVMPIDASNVAVVCPKTNKRGRVGYRTEAGKKVRYHKASGEELP